MIIKEEEDRGNTFNHTNRPGAFIHMIIRSHVGILLIDAMKVAKNQGAFLLPEAPEAPDFFSRTADGAPLRAIEARVCSPCAPSPPACAPRSLAGWQAAKTAWAELHQPRRTARTSSADRDCSTLGVTVRLSPE